MDAQHHKLVLLPSNGIQTDANANVEQLQHALIHKYLTQILAHAAAQLAVLVKHAQLHKFMMQALAHANAHQIDKDLAVDVFQSTKIKNGMKLLAHVNVLLPEHAQMEGFSTKTLVNVTVQ